MKFSKKYKTEIVVVLIIVLLVSAFSLYFKKQSEYTESRYNLEEIESGIYARYYQTVSSIPAQNYEVVEICINGNIYTYKGTVTISYMSGNPYVIIMENNIVHGDRVYLYVQKGTVDFRESVGVR